MTDPVLVTPPAYLAVSLPDMKAHLRVSHCDEDVLIAGLIEAATQYLDGPNGVLGRALALQVWREEYENFSGCMPIRTWPVVDIVSVTYTDDVGVAQSVLDARVIRTSGRAYIAPAVNGSWPSGRDVVVDYTAGSSAIPAPIRQAIMLHVGAMYEHRESVSEKALVPFAYEALITPYRRSLV